MSITSTDEIKPIAALVISSSLSSKTQSSEDKEVASITQRTKSTFVSLVADHPRNRRTATPFRPLAPTPTLSKQHQVLETSDMVRKILSFIHPKDDLATTSQVSKFWRTQSHKGCIEQLKERTESTKKCSYKELEHYKNALQLEDIDSVFGMLWEYCDLIETIDLSHSDIRTAQLQHFITLLRQFCSNLSKADLTGCSLCSNEGLIPLFENFSRFVHVSLSSCSLVNDQVVIALADNCADLTSVNLSKCPLITDTSTTLLAVNCPRIEKIDLSGCTRLTDDTLCALSGHAPNLKMLSLVHCSRMSDAEVRSFVLKCTDLKELSISSSIDDPFITELVKTCSKLTHVSFLNGSDSLTGRGAAAIFQAYPHLISASFSHHTKLTDQAVLGLKHHQDLLYLDFSSCPKITDKALLLIAQECPKLRKINLEYCHGVTEKGIAALIKGCPDLQDVGTSVQQNIFNELKKKRPILFLPRAARV